jgi:hypothetical protein
MMKKIKQIYYKRYLNSKIPKPSSKTKNTENTDSDTKKLYSLDPVAAKATALCSSCPQLICQIFYPVTLRIPWCV